MKINRNCVFVFVLSVSLLLIANTVFGSGNWWFSKKNIGLTQLSSPIEEDCEVLLKNIITCDKKFACIEVRIKWRIESLSKPIIIFNTEEDLIEHINRYLRMKVRFASSATVVKVESIDFAAKIAEIQTNILNRLKEKFNMSVIKRNDIQIEDVKITEYVILDKEYGGESFPEA